MKGETHVDLSLVAAEYVGWAGDAKLLARNARYPDDVCATMVDGVGAHIFGLNLESLKHFGKMVPRPGPGGGHVPEGYRWKGDPSIPHINLPDRAVYAAPEAWGPPVGPLLAKNEPLAILLRDLAGRATVAADEITYPAATTMACWCETVIRTLPRDMGPAARQIAVDTVAGWCLHFIQDLCIPQHAACYLGAGHATYEAELAEMWQRYRSAGGYIPQPDANGGIVLYRSVLSKGKDDAVAQPLSIRALAERVSLVSYVGRSALGWRRWFWRPGWKRLMRDSIGRGFEASCSALRLLGTM